LITITGGKWTTYRKMAEDSVNKAIETGGLKPVSCNTMHIPIHGMKVTSSNDLSVYGTDEENIKSLIKQTPLLATKLVEHLPYTKAEVVWVVRNEMARTIEDVLARRLRVLFLDAAAAIEAAPHVAALMAEELGYGESWIRTQIEDFTVLANRYLLSPLLAPVNVHSAELV
jgi:glycerol-3-phosphate dehydrogenase